MSRFSLSSLANSVLPVPVGPRNKNEAMGLFGVPIPEKLMYTRSNTASTADSCPYSFCLMFDSRSTILRLRSFCSLSVGTPVTRATCSSIIDLFTVVMPESFTRSRAHAASNKSIDLSGFFLSWMYRAARSTAAVMASVSIMTLWNASKRGESPIKIFSVVSRSGSSIDNL